MLKGNALLKPFLTKERLTLNLRTASLRSDGTQATLPQAYTFKSLSQLPLPDPGPGGPPKRLRIPLVIDSTEFRTNLGINNLSSIPATVTIFLLNNHGEVIATQRATVPPNGLTQLLNVIRYLEGTSELTGREGSLILESVQNVTAWASLIDNLTGDPSLQIARTESEAASLVLLPTSASVGRFSTSLIVVNNTFSAGRINIRARQASGAIQASLFNLELEPNGYIYFEDFYSEIGLSGVFGPIEIEAVGAIKILAAARIYTREGTSGFLDGVDVSLASKKVVLPYSLDTVDFRTNLGITNPGNNGVNVTVNLLDRDGLKLGTLVTSVPAHGLTQINNVNQELVNSGTVTNQEGYLELKADHAILGWTSQIDNVFSDLSMVVGKSSIGATKLLIPSAANTVTFRSSLAIVNLDSMSANVQITALDNEGNVRQSSEVTIPGNGFLFYGNILASLVGQFEQDLFSIPQPEKEKHLV